MAYAQDLFTGEITEYCEDCSNNGTDKLCIECQWCYATTGKDRYGNE
jgi:hypothetical protein